MRAAPGRTPPAGLWSGDARLVVQAWLGTRLVLALTLAWLMVSEGRGLDELDNWDVEHYLRIATDGYTDPTKYAFFPGWPLLLRLVGATGVPVLIAATLLALAFSGLAAAALYRLAGAGPVIAWLLAPTAIFTAVGYTESLFCAAAFWAWERASSRHWGAAALLAAVAASVRVSGIFLIGALAILALTQDRDLGPPGGIPVPAGRRWLERLRRLAWLLVPVAAVAGYLGYLYLETGNWLAWFDAQASGWTRDFTWPWEALQRTLDASDPAGYPGHPEWAWVFRFEIVSMAVGVVVTAYGAVRRRWAEAAFVGVQVAAFAVSEWFMSVNRAVLLWFPLWILLGRVLEGRHPVSRSRRIVIGVVVAAALLVQAWWASLFLTGRWAS
ncbi:MAG: mannosyltransferase family protein [Propionicimonas sp.]|nr:mannosyltransferase family protein [Propionicimonas sp.]